MSKQQPICKEELDKIKDFAAVQDYCKKIELAHLFDLKNNSCIRLFKMSGFPPNSEYFLSIPDTYCVEAYRKNVKVKVHDLVDEYVGKLTKYSQIDLIVTRLQNDPPTK